MNVSLTDHISRLVRIDDEKLQEIDSYFQNRVVAKKELLLREGEKCSEKFFVSSGCLQLFYLKENGDEQTVDFALEGWWTTDFDAFRKQSASKFSIRCLEPCELSVIGKSAQDELLKKIPELEHYFHQVFQLAYAASQNRIKLLYELSREELYLHFLNNYPEFNQRVPQYLIASFLGFTPEYLSEIRKKYAS